MYLFTLNLVLWQRLCETQRYLDFWSPLGFLNIVTTQIKLKQTVCSVIKRNICLSCSSVSTLTRQVKININLDQISRLSRKSVLSNLHQSQQSA